MLHLWTGAGQDPMAEECVGWETSLGLYLENRIFYDNSRTFAGTLCLPLPQGPQLLTLHSMGSRPGSHVPNGTQLWRSLCGAPINMGLVRAVHMRNSEPKIKSHVLSTGQRCASGRVAATGLPVGRGVHGRYQPPHCNPRIQKGHFLPEF